MSNPQVHAYTLGGGQDISQPILWRPRQSGYDMHHVSGSEYETLVREQAAFEVHSNLPAEATTVDIGTDVITSDARKIGYVEDVVYDEDGLIVEFKVGGGVFHHHAFTIPIDQVASIAHRAIRLRIREDELEQAETVQDARPAKPDAQNSSPLASHVVPLDATTGIPG